MAPVKKTTSLRQGTLSFASSKPTAATTTAKQKNSNSVTVPPTSSKKRAVESSSEDSDEIESSSTPPPAKAEGKAHIFPQTSKGQTSKASAETRAEPVPTSVFKSKDATENSRAGKAAEEVLRPELNPKDRKYNKHYTLVREKMGNMPPSESPLMCLMLLLLIFCQYMAKARPRSMRFFVSLTCTSPVFPTGYYLFYYLYSSDQYGPCVGVTRIERWERASMLGLNPPPEVSSMVIASQSYLTPIVGLRHSFYQTGCNRSAICRKRFS